jgi:murein DD-endopeptidase MepM/ murein hydrolase activator NlpD
MFGRGCVHLILRAVSAHLDPDWRQRGDGAGVREHGEYDTITIDTLDRNHIVLDIGGGYFAFYAHLQKSVTVRVGDQVKKGAVLGKLGNSGNSSGPHPAFEAAPDLTGNWGKGSLSKPERHQSELPLNLNIIDFPPSQNSK